MNRVLADTSALYAVFERTDAEHGRATTFLRANPEAVFVLSNYIFAETVTLVRKRLGGDASTKVGERIRQSPRFEVVHLTEEDEEAVWEIFRRYSDKDWSWFDCTLYHLARKLGIWEVFTFDEHFRQMGLGVVP